MKRLVIFAGVIAAVTLVAKADAGVFWDFEDPGLGGITAGLGTITQDTIGATSGLHSAKLVWNGGWNQLADTNAGAVLDALRISPIVMFDMTLTEPLPWSNGAFMYQGGGPDFSAGWTQSDQVEYPTTVGTHTVIFDLTAKVAANPLGVQPAWWFQAFFAINGGPSTVYIDNFRTVPEPASMLALGAGVMALVARRRRKA